MSRWTCSAHFLNPGIPENVMTLDYAGFRTFDSIVRCKKVFNQDNFTIISQNFHNARALYIAHNEESMRFLSRPRTCPTAILSAPSSREYLARPKAVLDVHILRPAADVTSNIQIGKNEREE